MQIKSFVVSPIAWQRSVTAPVAAGEARVIPFSVRRCPARAGRVYEMPIASEAGVCAVAAVERDAFPIHKTAGGRCGNAHGVVIVDHPGAALADAARAVIEAN